MKSPDLIIIVDRVTGIDFVEEATRYRASGAGMPVGNQLFRVLSVKVHPLDVSKMVITMGDGAPADIDIGKPPSDSAFASEDHSGTN